MTDNKQNPIVIDTVMDAIAQIDPNQLLYMDQLTKDIAQAGFSNAIIETLIDWCPAVPASLFYLMQQHPEHIDTEQKRLAFRNYILIEHVYTKKIADYQNKLKTCKQTKQYVQRNFLKQMQNIIDD